VRVNARVALLFIHFQNPCRLRVNGLAPPDADDPLHSDFERAQACPVRPDAFKDRVVRLAPTWKALGLTRARRSVFAEIGRSSRK
jgi:hypothetical protein